MERFAREYVVDLDAGKAALRAGYSAKDGKVAATKASHLLKRPDVAALVASLKAAQFKRLDLKADDVLQEFMRLADVDPGKLYDAEGQMLPVHKLPIEVRRCISSVEYDANGLPKIRFWSKVEALGMLAKHFKVCVERIEVKDVSDRAERLARARARLAAATMPPAPVAASPV
jgi:phage terminase small subunit